MSCLAQVQLNPSSPHNGEGWSGLSDLLDLSVLDSSFHDEIQSTYKPTQGQSAKDVDQLKAVTKIKMNSNQPKRPSSQRKRERQRIYNQRFRDKVRSNPALHEEYRIKKNENSRKWHAKKVSNLNEEEKVAYSIKRNSKNRLYYKKAKKNFGGFSSKSSQRLNLIRTKKAEGKANEEDLKFLHDYRDKENAKKRKSYAAKKAF